MPKFNAEVPHGLGRDVAIERLKGFSELIKRQFADQVKNVNETWTDDGDLDFSFTTMGLQIAGRMTTTDDKVAMSGTLPFAASLFRGKIESEIRDQINKALS